MSPPLGIKFICGVTALTAPFAIIGGILVGGLYWIVAGLSVLALIGAFGLWTLKEWGWYIVVGMELLNIPYHVFMFITAQQVTNMVGVAIGVLILVYLYCQREVYLSSSAGKEPSTNR